jgi:signal transduction histidine kinase/HAMP domain-containing protein
MTFILTIISRRVFLNWPQDWLGVVSFCLAAAAIVWGNLRWRSYQRELKGKQRDLFFLLLVLAPAAPLFFGLRVSLKETGMRLMPSDSLIMFLMALPALLGGWMQGPLSATILGAVSGLTWALFQTQLPFSVLEISGLAMLFSYLVRQRYRTGLYRSLRRPVLAAAVLGIVYPFIYALRALSWTPGTFMESLDYSVSNFSYAAVAIGGGFLFSALIVEGVRYIAPQASGPPERLEPSPPETSLRARVLMYAVGGSLLAILVMLGLNWGMALRSAEGMLITQMSRVAETAAEEVPSFLNTGEELITHYAGKVDVDSALLDNDLEHLAQLVPFFDQIYVLDAERQVVAMYPLEEASGGWASNDELRGIETLLEMGGSRIYTLPENADVNSALISFLSAIRNSEGEIEGVLVGRVDLVSNPFAQSILHTLGRMETYAGVGTLLDGQERVLYTSDIQDIPAQIAATPGTDERDGPLPAEQSSKEPRQLVVRKNVFDSSWTVVATLPVSQAHRIALERVAPMSGIILLVGILSTLGLYYSLNPVARELHELTEEVDAISEGNLDQSLFVGDRVDEVGRLRRAFEKMRQGLQARMGELNRLLRVSQGVASTLEIEKAVQPILNAALETGGKFARIVFTPDVLPDELRPGEGVISFGIGAEADRYQELDGQILEMTRKRSPLRILNPGRMTLLRNVTEDLPEGMILSVALREDQEYSGALWLVFDRSYLITDSEMRFLTTLAGQAALATSNAQLFLRAEVERQRLATILTSTPDPVLVTDHTDRLLLANPAAWEVLPIEETMWNQREIADVLDLPPLVELLEASGGDMHTAEVPLEDGRVFQATASPIRGEDRELGRVCVLRDISYLKKMDELKSDFVATVSHDLRSPLTLMRGYATMLEMVGDLNEQQMGYVRKIVSGIESMSHLVMNLLDLGRIEADVGLNLEIITVEDVIGYVMESLQVPAKQKGIRLEVEHLEHTIPVIEADRVLLQQALHNLVENAIKYTPNGGSVWIRYGVEDESMLFQVEDTGVGISPVDKRRLFEKFYRVERKGNKKMVGMGLGLTIVKSIVEQHRGEIWVESELGTGSTFTFKIPLRQ